MHFRIKKLAVLTILLGLAFGYGAAMERYKLFPREYLRIAKGLISESSEAPREASKNSRVSATFADLELSSIRIPNLVGLGAIDAVGDSVIGSDRLGNFFYYFRDANGMPRIRELDVTIDLGYEQFKEHASGLGIDVRLDWFRIHDLLLDSKGNRLFLSHHYWDAENNCSTVRFSAVDLPNSNMSDLIVGNNDWDLIFETRPCVGLQAVGNPFEGLQSGGRMALLSTNKLVVTVGDHGLDGWGGTADEPQNPDSSYGKVWSVDLETYAVELISLGHRNPQGLLIDSRGRMWLTEHGPRGGDELNLIEPGANYGWPHVTYGTQYDDINWPRSEEHEQGRHGGYHPAVYAWLRSIGISQLIEPVGFLPEWEGDLLLASLKAGSLFRIRYEEGRVLFVDPINIRRRIRDLDQLDNGTVVLWTDDSEVVEMRPTVRSDLPPATIGDLDSAMASEVMNVIRICEQCHGSSPDAESSQAPSLWGVIGRDLASTEYPMYSKGLADRGGRWTRATLDQFLRDPFTFAPGTTMAFGGIADDTVRDEVIEYLESLQ